MGGSLGAAVAAVSFTASGSGSGAGTTGRKAVATFASADATAVTEDWPSIQAGVWETDCSRKLPHGRTQHWQDVVSECQDATELLRGYWGLGVVEEAGCRYKAIKLSPGQFKINSECMVRHIGVATSEAIAVIKNESAFEMNIRVVEGKRVYRASQIGRRRSVCPESSGAK